MSDLNAFRSLHGSRLVRDQIDGSGGFTYKNEKYSRTERFFNFFKSGADRYGTPAQRSANDAMKADFKKQLQRAEGSVIAQNAAAKAGLGPGWESNGKRLNDRKIQQVLDNAEHYRKSVVRETEKRERRFLADTSSKGFREVVAAAARPGAKTASGTNRSCVQSDDYRNPDVLSLFRREVRSHPKFGKQVLTPDDIKGAAQTALDKFAARKQSDFQEMHPGLAAYAQDARFHGTPDQDIRTFFTQMDMRVRRQPLSGEPNNFPQAVAAALAELPKSNKLLARMVYDEDEARAFSREFTEVEIGLGRLEADLRRLRPPNSDEGKALRSALIADLSHRRDALVAKRDFVHDVMRAYPLRQEKVAYSNLLWANAAASIFDEAIKKVENNTNLNSTDRKKYKDFLTSIQQDYVNKYAKAYENTNPKAPAVLPGAVPDGQHPAMLVKSDMRAYLRDQLKHKDLKGAFDDETIKGLTSHDRLIRARRDALNTSQDWQPIRRDMVVHRDGVTRTYESRITPASRIDARFAKSYGISKGGERAGVSALSKADATHARNLKISELGREVPDGAGKTKFEKISTVVGHGVLDMWEITNSDDRHAANLKAGEEVIEAALATNERGRSYALKHGRIKMTHVSVNQTTPASWREFPGMEDTKAFRDYQEKTYTEEQFKVFGELSGPSQPVTIADDAGKEKVISVDLQVIAFSFGINPLATGHMPDYMGGWANVYAYNKVMMERFVGDLGSGQFGSQGSRPGGFIGEVLGHLDMNKSSHRELANRIQEQSNIVRALFTSEDFKRGNGDPAKMSRHILALQTLAEEALKLAAVEDHVATMSRGCKSDKDRGGVIDVELKHMLITEDMGGHIVPDQKLEGDDQQNYYVVAASSGQLENQMFNTGLPGSKEAGKLKARIPDPEVRRYLAGLGAFAPE